MFNKAKLFSIIIAVTLVFGIIVVPMSLSMQVQASGNSGTETVRYLATSGPETLSQGMKFTFNRRFEAGKSYVLTFKLRAPEDTASSHRSIRMWVLDETNPKTANENLYYRGAVDGTRPDLVQSVMGCSVGAADGNGWRTVTVSYSPLKTQESISIVINGDTTGGRNDQYGGTGVSALDYDDFAIDGKLVDGGDFSGGDSTDEFTWVPHNAKLKLNYEVKTGTEEKQETPVQPVVPVTTTVNFLASGSFDDPSCLADFDAKNQILTHMKTEDGGHLKMSGIETCNAGFLYYPTYNIAPGYYKFEGYVKMVNPDELTHLRILFYDVNGDAAVTLHAYPTHGEWLKIEHYVTLTRKLDHIKICGGPKVVNVQPYLIDNFSLEKIDKIPAGANPTVFGTAVTPEQVEAASKTPILDFAKWDPAAEAQYEVQGLIINQDSDSFLKSCENGVTEQGIIDYVKSFEGSHITDYMICLNNTVAVFPSETWTDYLEKYHQTTENGQAVNYKNSSHAKGAYQLYEVAGLDYVDIWCKTFPTVGINPWLSFRMNDAHDLSKTTSVLLSDYFHENPNLRRVKHGVNNNTYFDNCVDYTHEQSRTHMLELINEALDRYDPYGIELDFQREIWLWYNGGEYKGLDILNDFMRKVNEVVAVYEGKYGHEIKIAVRVASDIQTNYDFGLDIVTWAAEGIIDRVAPSGRFATTDGDIPVRLWKSLLQSYDVEITPVIEANIMSHTTSTSRGQSLETMSAFAANFLSQGADKIYLFNYFRNYTNTLTEADRITTKSNGLSIGSANGYWNVITTLGSYDKLMTMNRRMKLTYNDTYQLWENANNQLPKNAVAGNTVTLRIPVGDIPEGAVATLKFSSSTFNESKLPKVYVNSKLCTYAGYEYNTERVTRNRILCYTIPAEAYDEMYVVAEITASESTVIDYAEVYIEPADK